jgi:hypothetical protein
VSPIVVSSKRKPATPLITPKFALSGISSGMQDGNAAMKRSPQPASAPYLKTNTPLVPAELHVRAFSFGQDALDLVCDPSVWS